MSDAELTFQTVAVYLPGTENRVLVTKLNGDDAEVRRDAKAIVNNFSNVAPAHWLTKVVARDEITDIPPQEAL
jgi:hypothetical protein